MCGNVALRRLVARNPAGVDVVRVLVVVDNFQMNTGMVIRCHIGIAIFELVHLLVGGGNWLRMEEEEEVE